MELEIRTPELTVSDSPLEITANTQNVLIGEGTKELEVTVNRREYNIVGDELYIPKRYEDAPQWLRDIIDTVTSAALENSLSDVSTLGDMLNGLIAELNVAKNTYTQSIISSNDIDERINTAITTLNSTLANSDSTILDIALTRVTPEQAETIAIGLLSASINSGDIAATVQNLQSAIANVDSARALDYIRLTAQIGDGLDEETTARATAVQYLNTYVGITDGGIADGTGMLSDIKILQKQNDGVIITTTGTYDVMIGTDVNTYDLVETAEPYATWIANESTVVGEEEFIRASHVGDVYIKYSETAGVKTYLASYKFVKTIIDNTTPYGTDPQGYTWAIVTDTDTQNAYMVALQAYDLADGKRRIFVPNGVTTPLPPYDVGDLWLVQVSNKITGIVAEVGDILRCTETKGTIGTYESNDWVRADNYRESMKAIQTDLDSWRTGTYSPFVTNIQGQVDGKAETFYQPSIPIGRINSINVTTSTTLDKYVGDLWKNTYVGTIGGYLGNNTEYVYTKTPNGLNWNYRWTKMEVPDIVFDTIDTKKSIYSGNSLPVITYPDTLDVNDMWITGSAPVGGYLAESIYVWNGTTWTVPVRYTDDQAAIDIINGSSKIDLSKHVNDLGWQTANETSTTASSILSSWVSSVYTPSQISTQSALDGKIESYFQSTAPYAASAGTASKDGDLWYNTSTKKLYRYVFSSKSWSIIEDQTAINAAAAASLAQSTADGKIVTYVGTTQPTAEGLGDIWIDTDDSNHMYRWDLNNWISIRDTTNDLILSSALEDIAGLEETNDGVVNSFYQTTAPTTGMSYGDWWVDTDSNPVKAYRYEDVNGKNVAILAWRDNSTHILGKSYIAAVGAQSTADGKIKTFYQNAVPTSDGAGDLWIDLDDNNKTYRAAIKGANEIKSGEWVRVTDDSALDSFLTVTYASDLLNTKNQLDGVAVTYFQDTAPYSASTGLAENAGDVWYKPTLGTAYKFVYKTFASDGTTITSASTWSQITNAVILSALSNASATVAAADRSIKNYTTQPFTPYYTGDTWMQGSTGDIYVCSNERLTGVFTSSDWVIASKYTNDDAVVLLKSGLANGSVPIDLTNAKVINGQSIREFVAEQIDNEVVVYSGTNVNSQTGMKADDIYIESTIETGSSGVAVDVVNTYVYSGTAWEKINSNNNLTALADLADGKRTVFSGSTVPTTGVVRDIWIPSANVTVGTTTYVKGEIYQYNGTSWIIATKYSSDIAALSSSVQTQIDSKVDTYYQTSVPFANATNVAKRATAGDYWYCTQDGGIYLKGKIYKYVESVNGSNYNYTWTLTTDISRDAFDLADGKSTIYTTASQPTKYNMNDMMIVVSSFNNGTTTFSDGVVLTATVNSSSFVASHWVKKINDTEDLDLFATAITGVTDSLKTQVDKKIEYWFQLSTIDPKSAWTTTALKLEHNGDIWYQTDTKKSYYYSNTTNTWNVITDKDAIDAIQLANTAQATADGKITIYYAQERALAPVTTSLWYKTSDAKLYKYTTSWVLVSPLATGDLVYTNNGVEDNRPYRYTGTAWVSARDGSLVATAEAVTTLEADLSDTNIVVGGHTTQLSTVDTRIAGGVASVQTKWAYDSIVNINGVYKKSGFGLTTNYTSGNGTQANPYVSEFWIDASRLKFTNSAMTGRTAPFTIDATGTTPQITFNGKVAFTNVTGTATHTSGTSSPTLGATTAVEGSTYYNTSTKSGYIVSNGSWINNSSVTDTSGLALKDMSNVTTIDGGKITTGIVSTNRLNVNDIMSKNMTFTGKITGGSGGLGGIIQSYNGKMTIDLVNGSIYIS